MKFLKLEEIAAATGGRLIDEHNEAGNIVIQRIVTDSRTIQAGTGDFFIPLMGSNFDGHGFISQAYKDGMESCFSEIYQDPCKFPYIFVPDAKKALGDLAEYYRSLFPVPVVAITGSMGKTTTKDLIASVLMQKMPILKTEGNFNNEIGLPLTLFRLEEKHKAIVLEMGMNNFGEIHNLSKIARPSIGVITNIGVSHIGNLGSRAGILRAKKEMFDFMEEDGAAILNGDDKLLCSLESELKNIVWFGTDPKRELYAEPASPVGLESIYTVIHTPKGEFPVAIPMPGNHMVLNALAATAVGLQFDLSLEEIKKGIEEFTPAKMRMSIIKTRRDSVIINDVYNANPISMKASLDVLADSEGKTAAILGDMFELGVHSEKMHYDVGRYAAECGIDTLICIGDACQEMYQGALDWGCKNVYYYPDQETFLQEGFSHLELKITILVKASRGMHLEKTVEKIMKLR